MRLGVLGCLLVLGAGPAALQLSRERPASPILTEAPATPKSERGSEAASRVETPGVVAAPVPGGAPSSGARFDLGQLRRSGRGRFTDPLPDPADWSPPEGAVRIGLQAGHWRADEAPRELSGLRNNGTRWGNVAEWQVNLQIARRVQAVLEEIGYGGRPAASGRAAPLPRPPLHLDPRGRKQRPACVGISRRGAAA